MDLFYRICSYTCFALILSGIFCAVVRWFHMCRPYSEHEKYFYPARRWATLFFAAVALEIPYVVYPYDTDVWLYIRVFGIVYYPFCFSVLFEKYFKNRGFGKDVGSLLLIAVPSLFIFGVLLLIIMHGKEQLEGVRTTILISAGVLSILLTIYFMVVVKWLRGRIDEFHSQNFSNEEDFPYRFAKKILYVPLVWIALAWVIFVTGSRGFKIFYDILLAVWMIAFLCMILHPQRSWRNSEVNRLMAEIEKEEENDVEKVEEAGAAEAIEIGFSSMGMANNGSSAVFSKQEILLRNEILAIVKQRYREPNLKRIDIIDEIQYGKRRQAGAVISKIGFYRMINAFRLEHARLYKLKRPSATQDEIAEVSGFKDRWALSNARKKVDNIDYEIMKDFLPTSV